MVGGGNLDYSLATWLNQIKKTMMFYFFNTHIIPVLECVDGSHK